MTDGGGNSARGSATVTVVATPTSLAIAAASGGIFSGTTGQFTVQESDQFGNALATPLPLRWSATTLPGGAAAPSFSASGAGMTATFSQAGPYTLSAAFANSNGASAATAAAGSVSVTVTQTLTAAALDAAQVQVSVGSTHQFTARAVDQFQKPMASQPTFTWTTTVGTITGGGLFTAPGSTGSGTVTATSGSLTASAAVTIGAGYPGIQDPALAGLVSTLDADGSINRLDMIQILDAVAQAGSTISTTDLNDLKTILTDAAAMHIPGYVQTLACNVIDGNAANANFQGQTLSNLSAGCPSSRLTTLVDKWFLGADHPATGYTYQAAAGTLFASGTPLYTDVKQGYLGDCYFIAALGTIAKSNPTAIENMFVNNGDGTWTVRFYSATAAADYVTVNNRLPVNGSGNLVYSDCGQSAPGGGNVLWLALAEKAYAQWNETGLEGRDGSNTYTGIEGGWMSVVDGQVLGRAGSDYGVTASGKRIMIASLGANKAVTAGTNGNPGNGLYGGHAYLVVGYSAGSDTFTLYNPWGFAQPGPLSWGQLEASCEAFSVADTSGSTAISSGPRKFDARRAGGGAQRAVRLGPGEPRPLGRRRGASAAPHDGYGVK